MTNIIPEIDIDEILSEAETLIESGFAGSSIKKKNNRVIGVIGGMGNEAMVDLMEKMSAHKTSSRDQYIFIGNSRLSYTPTEISSLKTSKEKSDERKRHTLTYTCGILQEAGCNILGMACNSGHAILRKIASNFDMTVIDMVKESSRVALSGRSPVILGTTSLIEDRLYQIELANKGKIPSMETMQAIMRAVYHPKIGVKVSGVNAFNYKLFLKALRDTYRDHKDMDSLILGCTELPLFFRFLNGRIMDDAIFLKKIKMIDPTQILADKIMNSSDMHVPKEITSDEYRLPKTDFYPLAGFKCKDIQQAMAIQKKILKLTEEVFSKFYADINKGSYLHLPTIFYVNMDKEKINMSCCDSVMAGEDALNESNGYFYLKIRKHIEKIIKLTSHQLKGSVKFE